MGADLNNIVKCQKLTDDHVQFLIYQILRGLKVRLLEEQLDFAESEKGPILTCVFCVMIASEKLWMGAFTPGIKTWHHMRLVIGSNLPALF